MAGAEPDSVLRGDVAPVELTTDATSVVALSTWDDMADTLYRTALVLIALGFTIVFCIVVIPPFLGEPDVVGAFAAGFVNPYSTGYSLDVVFCWLCLLALVVYDSRVHEVRHGWLCLIVGIVPGVAVGLALYLLLRARRSAQAAATSDS